MKENGRIISSMDKEYINGVLEMCIKENIGMAGKMDRGHSGGAMEQSTKENIMMIREMVTGNLNYQMEESSKEIQHRLIIKLSKLLLKKGKYLILIMQMEKLY